MEGHTSSSIEAEINSEDQKFEQVLGLIEQTECERIRDRSRRAGSPKKYDGIIEDLFPDTSGPLRAEDYLKDKVARWNNLTPANLPSQLLSSTEVQAVQQCISKLVSETLEEEELVHRIVACERPLYVQLFHPRHSDESAKRLRSHFGREQAGLFSCKLSVLDKAITYKTGEKQRGQNGKEEDVVAVIEKGETVVDLEVGYSSVWSKSEVLNSLRLLAEYVHSQPAVVAVVGESWLFDHPLLVKRLGFIPFEDRREIPMFDLMTMRIARLGKKSFDKIDKYRVRKGLMMREELMKRYLHLSKE